MLGLRKQILPQDLLIIEIFTLIEETFIRTALSRHFTTISPALGLEHPNVDPSIASTTRLQ